MPEIHRHGLTKLTKGSLGSDREAHTQCKARPRGSTPHRPGCALTGNRQKARAQVIRSGVEVERESYKYVGDDESMMRKHPELPGHCLGLAEKIPMRLLRPELDYYLSTSVSGQCLC